MVRMLLIVPAVSTPAVGLLTWISAYQIAVSHLGTRPCCENGMNMAPIVALSLGFLGLGTAGVIGVMAGIRSFEHATRTTLAVVAVSITYVTAAFMFVEPPTELTADKTKLGDYWPLTPDSVGTLVLGFILTVTPWTVALVLLSLDRSPRTREIEAVRNGRHNSMLHRETPNKH